MIRGPRTLAGEQKPELEGGRAWLVLAGRPRLMVKWERVRGPTRETWLVGLMRQAQQGQPVVDHKPGRPP